MPRGIILKLLDMGGGDHNHNQKKTKGYVGTAEQLEFSSETTGGEQVVEQQCLSAKRKKKKQSSWNPIL